MAKISTVIQPVAKFSDKVPGGTLRPSRSTGTCRLQAREQQDGRDGVSVVSDAADHSHQRSALRGSESTQSVFGRSAPRALEQTATFVTPVSSKFTIWQKLNFSSKATRLAKIWSTVLALKLLAGVIEVASDLRNYNLLPLGKPASPLAVQPREMLTPFDGAKSAANIGGEVPVFWT